MVLNKFKRRRKRLIAQSQPYQGMFHNTAKGVGERMPIIFIIVHLSTQRAMPVVTCKGAHRISILPNNVQSHMGWQQQNEGLTLNLPTVLLL